MRMSSGHTLASGIDLESLPQKSLLFFAYSFTFKHTFLVMCVCGHVCMYVFNQVCICMQSYVCGYGCDHVLHTCNQACVSVCVNVWSCVFKCLWRPDNKKVGFFLTLCKPIILRPGLHGSWSLLITNSVVKEPQESLITDILLFLRTGDSISSPHACMISVLVTKSSLQLQHPFFIFFFYKELEYM